MQKDIYTEIFIQALFVTTKDHKQHKWQSIENLLDKLRYIQTME